MLGFIKKIFGKKDNRPVVKDNNIRQLKIGSSCIELNKDIINLLWFENGPFKNYTFKARNEFGNDFFKISIPLLGEEEPSLINLDYPVNFKSKILPTDEIGYFPSYKRLTPEQKGIYLKWLENPFKNQNICIGYAFIFLYGLERFLFLNNEQRAFDLILQLKNSYQNKSFQSYASGSLLAFSLMTRSMDNLKKLVTQEDSQEMLEMKLLCSQPLTSSDLIKLASSVSFSNKRYIKNEYELFCNSLNKILLDKYGIPEYSLNKYDYNTLKNKNIIFTANYSLRGYTLEVPDILSNAEFKNEIHDLLLETHELTKLKLKDIRKNQKNA